MSSIGQGPEASGGISVDRFDLPAAFRFDSHRHRQHQLAWASSGVVTIGIDARIWILPRSRALWIPAGVAHDVLTGGATTLMGIYFEPRGCPLEWAFPTVVATSDLLGALLAHLGEAIPDLERRHAEAVVFDLLRPLPVSALDLPMPTDERGAAIAAALSADPADSRSLVEWGHHVGASARTLARIFERETGMGFADWRTNIRITSAVSRLALGWTVARVARDVGYASPSAFVAAFRRTVGTTPGDYFSVNVESIRSSRRPRPSNPVGPRSHLSTRQDRLH